MLDYPIEDLLSEEKCHEHLLDLFHNGELVCAQCGSCHYGVHGKARSPIIKCKVKDCGRIFNLFTNTAFQGTHFSCCKIVLILRGFFQGETTARLSRELGIDRGNLLDIRHKLQKNALLNRPKEPLPDAETETDELFQNAGEKSDPHLDPEDPPRRRANKKRGMERTKMIALLS